MEFEKHLLLLQANTIKKGFFSSLFIPVIIALILQESVGTYKAALWFIILSAHYIGYNFVATHIIATKENINTTTAQRILFSLSILSVALYASFFYFFYDEIPSYQRYIIYIGYFSTCYGRVLAANGQTINAMSYCIPLSIVSFICWGSEFDSQQEHLSILIVFISCVAHVSLCYFVSQSLYDSNKNSFESQKREEKINLNLEAALKSEEESNRSKTRFLASASHDLRQPLHSALLLLSILKKSDSIESKKETELLLEQSLNLLKNQLDSILDISKIDASITEPDSKPIDMSILLNATYNNFIESCSQQGLTLNRNIHSENIFIDSDSALISRVLNNIIENAIKYTSKGSIDIESDLYGDKLLVTISDSGMGIKPENISIVFEEFFQEYNPERSTQKGIGLGLSIVKRLADLLDIKINIQSQESIGTTFSLIFKNIYIKPISNPPIEPTPTPVSLDISKEVFLIIDDDPLILQATALNLQHHQAKTFSAQSIGEARSLYRKAKPSIIISDHRLPDSITGLELILEIAETNSECQFVLISGDSIDISQSDLNEDRLLVLTKPVILDKLLESISSLIAKRNI